MDACQKKTEGRWWGCRAGGETGFAVPFTARKVSTRVLNLIRAVMGSQWREMRSRVTWERLGRLKTRRAAAFWILLRMLGDLRAAVVQLGKDKCKGLAAGWNAQTGIS